MEIEHITRLGLEEPRDGANVILGLEVHLTFCGMQPS